MAAKSKWGRIKADFVQQSNRITVIEVGLCSGNIDTVIKLLYKCVRLYPQFSTRIDIPEIETESSFHSRRECLIMESFNIYENTQLKKSKIRK